MSAAKINAENYAVTLLMELRKRLLQSFVVLGLVLVVCSFFANKIYHLFALPLLHHVENNSGLIATSVPAPFLIPFKCALIASFFITMPYWLYQIWMFVTPALYRHERKMLWLLLFSSSILFYFGTAFAYFVILPTMFKFFIYIAPLGVEVKPDISQYLSFVVKIFFSFGLAFELPIAIILLTWFNICQIETIAKQRSYVIVGAFVVGLLLTPDVVSQTLLAIPLWLLFELGLILSRITKRNQV